MLPREEAGRWEGQKLDRAVCGLKAGQRQGVCIYVCRKGAVGSGSAVPAREL